MPQGIQVWNASGVETSNPSRQVGRVFGAYPVPRNIQSGTITDSRFTQATPFFFFVGDGYEITITINTTTGVLSWSRTGGTVSATTIWGYLYYGTYA